MYKKSNIILSIIIVSFIISVCSIGVVQDNPSTQIKKQDDDIITDLSVPETSGYTVTEKWRWNNTFAGDQNAGQVEISLDGNYIVTRWSDHPNATLFKKDSNSTVWIYECASDIRDVAISGDGQYIVVSNYSHVIFLNNSIETPKKALWEYNFTSPCSVDISLTGDYIVAINQTWIMLLDKAGNLQWSYDTQDAIGFYPRCVAISGDGKYVISGDRGNENVYLFNTTDYQDTYMWKFMGNDEISKVAISDDGNYAVASTLNNENVFFFNTTDYDPGIPMWSRSFGPDTFIFDMAISSDGKNIAVAGQDKHYYFNNSFSTGEKQPMWSYNPERSATSIDITADGKYVLGGSYTVFTAYLFNNSITNPKEAEWSSSNIDIRDVAISGWGNYFVIGTNSEEIILFHHARPIPPVLAPLVADDDDDDEETPAIPFGNYYLIFAVIAMVALIVIIKRKAIQTRNKL